MRKGTIQLKATNGNEKSELDLISKKASNFKLTKLTHIGI
jgi:hypothetical protein